MNLVEEGEVGHVELAVGLVVAEAGIHSFQEYLVELLLHQLLGVGV